MTGDTRTMQTCELITPAAGPSAAADPGAQRVLLVEDHADTREMMCLVLRTFGYDVTVATTVREAIAIAERERFHLLVSDIGLPDGTGLDVMKYVAARFSLRGIALSGLGHEADLRRSREAGFSSHLIKPVNIDVLRDALERAAGH